MFNYDKSYRQVNTSLEQSVGGEKKQKNALGPEEILRVRLPGSVQEAAWQSDPWGGLTGRDLTPSASL